MHIGGLMLQRLRSLVGLIVWVTFTANSLVPGLMHRCDADRPAAARAMADCDHGDATVSVAMGPMAEQMAHHPTPSGTPSQRGDCHCIGRSCCSGALALPANSVAVAAVVHAVIVAAPTAFITAPASRPSHLLPFAQAPPLLA
jgi:hypothetical protein